MATQYTLTTAFAAITETEGTIQNVGIEDVELASDTNPTAGEGIVLHPGEKRSFSGSVYARKMGENGGTINVVDFKENAGGGDSAPPAYIPKGSVLFASLPATLDETMLGWTYNISDEFVTDSRFVEGSSKYYPAGENIVVVEPSAGVYKFDCFGGSYILPTASESVKGGIKIGNSFGVDSDILTLNVADESLVGGVKSSTIDGGVSVDSLGNMSIILPTASASIKGGVKLGDSFDVDDDVLILNPASDSVLGGVKSSTIGGGVGVDSDGNMSVNTPVLTAAALLNWQPSTAYAVGDVVYTNTLAITQKLVCVQAGTSGSTLTISSNTEGVLVTDGTVTWQVDSFADGDYSAEHGNGIYRGADVTTYFESGLLSTNIAAGKFVGVHIGDFITKTINLPAITYTDKSGVEQTQAAQTFTNVKWYVAAIDPHIHCGDTATTAHHVLLISANTLQRNVSMNPTNDTTGAYTGSDIWRVHIPNWTAAIKAAFGESHVVKHREWLSNAINATAPSGAGSNGVGASTGWAWTDVEVNIPNEQMIYGGRVFGSGHDCGEYPGRLPLFAMKQYVGGDDRSWYWLRAVASASTFASAVGPGYAGTLGASYANAGGGVRPYFLLY